MKKAIITVTETQTALEIHRRLAEQLGFPDTYGNNLDALYDCLTELTEPTEIHLTKADENPVCTRFLKVMQDAAKENPQLHIIIK